MEPTPLQQTIDDMQRFIQVKTATGFASAEEIAKAAVEVFSDEQKSDVLLPIAEQLTHDAIEAQLAAQEQWPAVTDCDLLDRAFAELERAGVVARQDFTCCQT